MKQATKDIILEAISYKKAQILRQQKEAKPRFAEIYQIDLDELATATQEIIKLKAD